MHFKTESLHWIFSDVGIAVDTIQKNYFWIPKVLLQKILGKYLNSLGLVMEIMNTKIML